MGFNVGNIQSTAVKKGVLEMSVFNWGDLLTNGATELTLFKQTVDVTGIDTVFAAAYNPSNQDIVLTLELDGSSAGTVTFGNAARGDGTIDISSETGEKVFELFITSVDADKRLADLSISFQEA